MPYEHRTVEPKWQARWREAGLHKTPTDPAKPKFYALDMMPPAKPVTLLNRKVSTQIG